MLQEIWKVLSENPIFSGVTVLFLGFISKKIYRIIFANSSMPDFQKPEIKIDSPIKLENDDNKSEIKSVSILTDIEKEMFREVSRFYSQVESKMALFHEICINDDYVEKVKEFILWQSRKVQDLNLKLESEPDISKDFEIISKKLLVSIDNTYELYRSTSASLENPAKLTHINAYIEAVKTNYLKFKELKSK
jgi:hypothetical protein